MFGRILRLIITLLMIICICVLSYMLYQGLNKGGINTNISGVERLSERKTSLVEKDDDKGLSTNTGTIVIPSIHDDDTKNDSSSTNTESQPSIIVDKPIRREQSDISSNTGDSTERVQSSIMYEDGAILEVLEVVQIIDEVDEEESLWEIALKLKQEKEARNQGRMLAGIEVAPFVDVNGNKLESSTILSKPIVVVAWKSDDVDYVALLNKLYLEYKDNLHIIFLSRNSDEKELIEELVKDNKFSFKCYYDDTSASFAGYAGLSPNTEVLFINTDDYIVSRAIGKTDEKELRNQFDGLVD